MEENNTTQSMGQSNQEGAGEGQQAAQQNQQQGRTFTQEEVNQIVQSRLARARFDSTPDLAAREAELSRRELQLEAREKLADAGLPKELVTALNCADKETMEKSINTILAFSQRKPASSGYKLVSTCSAGGTGGSQAAAEAEIRKAMGLKG